MSERMKILKLLGEGKITPEQAEQLLQALEGKEKGRIDRLGDRFSFTEFKNLGSQLSTAVAQSLGDVKRVVEQQFNQRSPSGNHLSASHQLSVPAEVINLSVETGNGKIQVSSWDEPHARIEIRATMRTHHLQEARQSLERALQINHEGDNYALVIQHGWREANQVWLAGAHVDVYVPKHLRKLHVRTRNGAIYADPLTVQDLHVETSSGAIGLYQPAVLRLHAETDNGGVDIQGLGVSCRNAYVYTRNGTIVLEGVPVDACITGTARTAYGKIDIQHPSIRADFDDPERKMFARLYPAADPNGSDETSRLHMETKNGSIRLRD